MHNVPPIFSLSDSISISILSPSALSCQIDTFLILPIFSTATISKPKSESETFRVVIGLPTSSISDAEVSVLDYTSTNHWSTNT